jgi:hypothetical protein
VKPCCSNQRNRALTLTEVLVVICVVAMLVALILPMLARAKDGRRPPCLNNLKQIALASFVWAGDHGDKFPVQVSVTNWGARELALAGDVAGIFCTMSNELSSPKILFCPEDRKRKTASDFGSDFNRTHVSYFVGIDAERKSSLQMILAGDDNLLVAGKPVQSGILNLATNAPVEWTKERIKKTWSEGWVHALGNLALADGSVWQGSDEAQLLQKLIETGLATNRLALP